MLGCACCLIACSSPGTNDASSAASTVPEAGGGHGGTAVVGPSGLGGASSSALGGAGSSHTAATTPSAPGGAAGDTMTAMGEGGFAAAGDTMTAMGEGGFAAAGDTMTAMGEGGFGGVTPAPSSGGTFALTCPAIENVAECSATTPASCGLFPPENTSYLGNANVSPELAWSGAPAGTQSFALVLRDVSFGQPHWAIWNLPGDSTLLPADVQKDTNMPATPAGSTQSNATFAEGDGYFGPQADCNVYEFKLYALSLETFTPAEPAYVALVEAELDALGDALLGQATLRARNDVAGMCD